MNLVDAIRLTTEGPLMPSVAVEAPSTPEAGAPPIRVFAEKNFVRLELFLSPDQIQALLKDSVGAHRAIMTVSEVAHLLRTTSKKVEHLAEDGQLPGFKLDDAWRFKRSVIEEWISTNGVS